MRLKPAVCACVYITHSHGYLHKGRAKKSAKQPKR